MTIVEGHWDCSQCLTLNILGRFKECPECGEPRDQVYTPDERVRFDGALVVTDQDQLDEASAGPDWICGNCGVANRGDTANCRGCVRPKDSDDIVLRETTYVGGTEADDVVFSDPLDPADDIIEDALVRATRIVESHDTLPRILQNRIRPYEELPKRSVIADRLTEYRDEMGRQDMFGPLSPLIRSYNDHKKGVQIGVASAATLIALLSCFFIVRHLTATHPVDMTVTSLTWDRKVEVEQYRTLTEEDWDVPSGGREIRTYEAILRHEKVFDGYENEITYETHVVSDGTRTETFNCGFIDKGNGYGEPKTCTRQVPQQHVVTETKTISVPKYRYDPVYDTMHVYQIDRWVFDHWVTSSGGNGELDKTPRWPEVTGLQTDQRVSGKREGTYHVGLRSVEKKTYSQDVDQDIWDRLQQGDKVVGNVRNSGALSSVDWFPKAPASADS